MVPIHMSLNCGLAGIGTTEGSCTLEFTSAGSAGSV